MRLLSVPEQQGLYDPRYEHDPCGVGFVADIEGRRSHRIISDALEVLLNLEHRGASGCKANSGDGAGILIQTPHEFLSRECRDLPAFTQYAAGMVFLPSAEAPRKACEARYWILKRVTPACSTTRSRCLCLPDVRCRTRCP